MKLKQFELFSDFLTVKAADGEEDTLRIQGYANTTTKDRHNDIIPKEAWEKGGLSNYQKNPVVLAYHNHSRPIGTVESMDVDNKGLKVTAKISKAAGEVYSLIKEGILKTFSVGFIVKDADYDSKTDLFVVKDLELLEISVVSVPANQDSTFSLAKSFESDNDLEAFKKSFEHNNVSEPDKPEVSQVEEPEASEKSAGQQEEFSMPLSKEDLESLSKAVAVATAEAIKANQPAAPAAPVAPTVEVGQSGAEKLLKELEDRFEQSQGVLTKGIEDLRGELAEKSAELEKIQKSKARFVDTSDGGPTYAEKEAAFLLSKATGKKIEETKLFANIVQKFGPHVASGDWELEISTNMQNEIRRRLIIAPLFGTINMNGPVMRLPVNPEAGYATWVQAAAFKTANSSGSAQTHVLKEITLTAHKLATKEFLGNEEEDDSIIPLLPIIRDAIVRRMAKAQDKALILGAGAGADPIAGLTTYNVAGDVTASVSAAASSATLRAMRKSLGVWGLNPADLVYVVSQDVYYDLLDDANFLTVDKVGDRATLLTGQVGSVSGTPVIVSGEFAAKAATAYGAFALNAQNFRIGRYKNLRLESDYIVEEQQKLVVASERMAFQQLTTVDGDGVVCFKWTV